jgi:hypothetical protein
VLIAVRPLSLPTGLSKRKGKPPGCFAAHRPPLQPAPSKAADDARSYPRYDYYPQYQAEADGNFGARGRSR